MHTRPPAPPPCCHGRPHPTSPASPSFPVSRAAGERMHTSRKDELARGSGRIRPGWQRPAPAPRLRRRHILGRCAARRVASRAGCPHASQAHVALQAGQLAVAGRTSITGPFVSAGHLLNLELASWGAETNGEGLKGFPAGPLLLLPRGGFLSRSSSFAPAPGITLCLLR